MKKTIHRNEERGKTDIGWLKSRFSFSFSNYYNPKRIGFGKLVVLNDDVVDPKKGFGEHPHSNMEIISIPTFGRIAHKDSTGVEEIVKPGEIQVMSGGSGIIHSEYNPSDKEKVKFFQIWIEPKEQNIKPRHDKKNFELDKNKLITVVSGEKNSKNLYIHQDAKISLGKFDKGNEIGYNIKENNGAFIFLIEGEIEVEGEKINKRDSIEISETKKVEIKTIQDSYLMIVEVPMN